MLINGYDFKFAYTVGAYCSIYNLHLTPPKNLPEQIQEVRSMAVIMSKAYEDKMKLDDPSYKVRYLTREEIDALPIQEVAEKLLPEVYEAMKEGQYRTVEAKTKKAKGAAK